MNTRTTSQPIRVLCVDDHPLVRKGIIAILANESDIELVAEGSNGREAVESYRRHQPDVTLMDLRMSELDGIAATRQIRDEFPGARIIALTSYDGDRDILRALEAGVRGYLLKEVIHTEILSAIRRVHAGQKLMSDDVSERLNGYFPAPNLTPREIEVLQLVAQGLANKEIAARLGTAAGTVKIQVQNILAKLNASDRTHAVTLALQLQIIRLS
jgi:DNA-binding NarL/FixJ family response regulator